MKKETSELRKSSLGVLFRSPSEKGAREWKVFNVLTGDIVDAYRVKLPRSALTAKGEHRTLYIAYPTRLRPAH